MFKQSQINKYLGFQSCDIINNTVMNNLMYMWYCLCVCVKFCANERNGRYCLVWFGKCQWGFSPKTLIPPISFDFSKFYIWSHSLAEDFVSYRNTNLLSLNSRLDSIMNYESREQFCCGDPTLRLHIFPWLSSPSVGHMWHSVGLSQFGPAPVWGLPLSTSDCSHAQLL